MIAIIDYGMGNLRSVQKAFHRIGADAIIAADKEQIQQATKLILPGVGHFEKGMLNLREKNLIDALKHSVIEKKIPILGICLGMQLLTSRSEEGNCDGLGFIDAQAIHFSKIIKDANFKIPHIGWNSLHICKNSDVIASDENMMYFVHSFAVKCNNKEDVLVETTYGDTFHSGFQKDNIIGLQFHPEKSHKPGLEILRNFVKL